MIYIEPATNYPSPYSAPLEYPGKRPHFSYLYWNGYIYPISSDLKYLEIKIDKKTKSLNEFINNKKLTPIENRYAILAYGSNACPGQLDYKFNKIEDNSIIVLKGKLINIDVVFSPRIASYGSIPATIKISEGTIAECWVNLLTEEQLKFMDISESRDSWYDLVEIKKNYFEISNNNSIMNLYAYIDKNGVLAIDKNPVRLSEVNAINPKFKNKTQKEILTYINNIFKFESMELYLEKVSNSLLRRKFSEVLLNNYRLKTEQVHQKIPIGIKLNKFSIVIN